jgi:DNA (cytosine-5)-methyltransferase 1
MTIYNEIDPYAAKWIGNLVAAGHVAPGEVETRSIRELQPGDVQQHGQAHFFAGIGVWSHALRAAGWPDDEPVWTGSCPCQPFSSAGRRGGVADDRHLWPEWFRLIRECRPPVVFGEQVASADGYHWLDAVRADLEGEGYAFGAADLCAAGVGAPHARQRLFFVAHSDVQRCSGLGLRLRGRRPRQAGPEVSGGSPAGALADDTGHGRSQERSLGSRGGDGGGTMCGDGSRSGPPDDGAPRLVGDSGGAGIRGDTGAAPRAQGEGEREWGVDGSESDEPVSPSVAGVLAHPGSDERGPRRPSQANGHGPEQPTGRGEAVRGFWSGAEWIYCRDDKWRAVEPGTFPLAHGVANRVGKLRAFGNAICAPVATTFVRAVMGALG